MPYSMQNPMPIVVLISGNGSNLQAMIDAIAAQELPVCIKAVISNRADAFGLERAEKAHIPTHVISHLEYADRAAYDAALQTCIETYHPAFIVLAGFMRVLTTQFVQHFSGKIINIHPSLLPKYRGLHTHQRVLEAGDREHGVTVHRVTAELDAGEILAQAKIVVSTNDTVETLEAKIHQLEHQLYPAVLKKLATACTS